MQEKKNQKDLKELAVFEMLEDAANDSSFCSTSSRVKTLMNHSVLPSPQVHFHILQLSIMSLFRERRASQAQLQHLLRVDQVT